VVNLPTVSSPLPRDLQQFVQRVREVLDGGGEDAVVTTRQLIASGLAESRRSGRFSPVGGVIDPARASRNLSASGALGSIILSWDAPNYNGHAYTEIWAHTSDVLGDAVLVGMTAGNSFAHTLGVAATRYYWVRNINQNGVASAYNATNGTQGSTGQDPAYLLTILNGEITSSQLATALSTRIDLIDGDASVTGSVNQRVQAVGSVDLSGLNAQYTVKIDNNGAVAGYGLASTTTVAGNITSEFIVNADRFGIMRGGSDATAAVTPFVVQTTATTVNGETVPVGVYIADAFIKNGTITNAKIGDAAVDSAKIANATIVGADIANATIQGANIGNATITSANIATATITSANIANATIQAADIADAAITTAKIQDLSVTSGKFGDAVITNAKIANAAISSAKIQDLAVTSSKFANAVITNAKIANAAITTAKIGNNQVTFPQFAQGSSSTILQYTNTAETTLVSLTVYNSGASAQVTATMNTSHSNNTPTTQGNEYRLFHFRLYRGSSLLTGFNNMKVGGINVMSAIINKLDSPGVGYHTYTLKVQNTGGNTARTLLFYPSIAYLELKR